MNYLADHRVLIQGITELEGQYYTSLMQAYGTNIIAGVSAGKGTQVWEGIPIYDLVAQAIDEVGKIDTSIIFVSSYLVKDAVLEAIAAGIRQIIIVTSGVPPLDTIYFLEKAQATNTLILGPSSAGIIIPEQILLGTSEPQFYTYGQVALISRSHCLTHEVALTLNQAGIGQSIAVNLGNQKLIGSSFEQWLSFLEEDEATQIIVLIGKSGDCQEQSTARHISKHITKPVIMYLAGQQFPTPSNLRYSWVQPRTNEQRIEQKIASFAKVDIPVVKSPSQVLELVTKLLWSKKTLVPAGDS